MEYTLVVYEGFSRKSFEHEYNIFIQKVNEKIKEGWVPQGGVSRTCRTFMQAMVKH